jgi:hypothetical protein
MVVTEIHYRHEGHDFIVSVDDWGQARRRALIAAGFLIGWLQSLSTIEAAALHRALRSEDDSAPIYHRAIAAGDLAALEAHALSLPKEADHPMGSCAVSAG